MLYNQGGKMEEIYDPNNPDHERDLQFDTIDNREFALVRKFADDVRKCFPIVSDGISYDNDIKNIVSRKIWDVLANIEDAYKAKFEFYAYEQARLKGKI
jgi:hypothetical protein